MSRISIDTAANFIRSHCLKDWTLDQVKMEIIKAINDETLIYTTDDSGNLNGICIGHNNRNKKQLHISAIVAKGQLKRFIAYFKEKYKGYTVTAFRREKFKQLKI